jgi:Ras-related protein Rab-1A
VIKYSNPDYSFKVLLRGDDNVGKSCLILRYTDDIYVSSPISSIGVDFKTKSIALNGDTVKLQIWDTTRQERRLLQANPYRGAHAIIVAFDVTNRASFDNVHQHLKEIDRFADENVVVTLVATKCDAPKAEWKVSEEEIKTFAMHLNKNVFFTSAKSEENGFVDQLFEGVAKSILADKIEASSSGPSSLPRR